MVSTIIARAPLPESGFISMVGRPFTQAGSQPMDVTRLRHPVHKHIQGTAGPQHADGHQHRHQIRNNGHRGVKAVFGSFDEGLIGIDPLHQGADEKGGDQPEQKQVADQGRPRSQFLRRQMQKPGGKTTHQQGSARQARPAPRHPSRIRCTAATKRKPASVEQ